MNVQGKCQQTESSGAESEYQYLVFIFDGALMNYYALAILYITCKWGSAFLRLWFNA